MEHSAVTEAQFQAAATLRDAALRDWSALPHAERVGLRQFCLGAALRTNPVPPPVVLSQLVSTLAVLLKRAWLDDDADRGAMLAEAEAAVASASTSAARRTGLKLFSAVISEFSPSTASPMNLPWDFHERCRASLEADFLLHFFAHGAGIARRCHESGAASTGRDEGVCVAALELMTTALAWDFARGGAGAGSGAFALERRRLRGGGDGPLDKDSKITPGAPWREALLAPRRVGLALRPPRNHRASDRRRGHERRTSRRLALEQYLLGEPSRAPRDVRGLQGRVRVGVRVERGRLPFARGGPRGRVPAGALRAVHAIGPRDARPRAGGGRAGRNGGFFSRWW